MGLAFKAFVASLYGALSVFFSNILALILGIQSTGTGTGL